MTSKELCEKRGPVAKQIKDLADLALKEGRDFTAEEKATWDKLNGDCNLIERQIEIAKRAELVMTSIPEPRGEKPGQGAVEHKPDDRKQAPESERRDVALQAWCRYQSGMDLTDEQAEACRSIGVNPRAREFVIPLNANFRQVKSEIGREVRAIGDSPQTVTTTAGGYLIPIGFSGELEKARLQFGGMLQAARILRTASGNQIEWPTTNDTGNTGELLSINTAAAEQAVVIGQKVLNAFKFSSKGVTVPTELLQDSAFNLASEIGMMLGERLGRIQNTYYTTGSGSSQPQGLIAASNGATVGKTAASATALDPDEILDLIHSVDPAYRSAGRFMFHDNTLLVLRKLKDGEGRYLWQPGTTAGEPSTIFGFPYTINQDMASSLTASAKPILFGDFSKFVVREVAEVRLRRLVEVRATLDQEVFVAFMRGDSEYINAGTNPIKCLQMAA